MAHVLVVDDENGIRITLKEFLEGDGHQVVVAEDFEEGFARLQTTVFDVVISDIVLPKQSGLDMLKAAREFDSEVQVIIITGEPTVDTAVQAVRMGAFDYLAKPVTGRKICEIVAEAAAIKQKTRESELLWEEVQRHRDRLRKEVEAKTDALFESQEGYRVLVESSSDAISIVDKDGRFLFLNSVAAKRVRNSTPDQLIGKTMWDLFPQEVADRQFSSIKASIESMNGCVIENMTMVDGESRWYRTCLQPIQNREGEIEKALVIAADINEQKLAEAALRESEERYRTLIENIGEGVAVVDPDEVISFANPAAEQMFGVGPGSLVGRNLRDHLSPESYQIAINQTKLRRKGDKTTYEMEVIRPDGQSVDCLVTATPQFDANGQFCGALGIFRNTTEAKLARRKLEESEQKYRNLVELAVDGICIVQDARIVFANPQLGQMFGYQAEELIGQPFSRYLHIDSLEKTEMLYEKHMSGERDMGTFEIYLQARDGSRCQVELNSSIIDYQGLPAELIMVRDIGPRVEVEREKQRLEKHLFESQKLEAVGRLAAGVAHDFNNLLTGITGNVSLAMMDIEPDDPLTELLVDVQDASARAADLTRQLLIFKRRTISESREINLTTIVLGMEKMLRRVLLEDIPLRLDLSENLEPVFGDPGLIEQAILNLVMRARDGMNKGGTLRISTSQVQSDDVRDFSGMPQNSGNHVCLTLHDTGTSIDPEQLKRYFEPYFSSDNEPDSTKFELATVYGIVRQHGGSLDVISDEKGNQIRLYLPCKSEQEKPLDAAVGLVEMPTGHEFILLVEDDPAVRSMAEKMLEKLGYRTQSCATAEEAIERLQNNGTKFDLLLVDVVLPGLDGVDLSRVFLDAVPEGRVLFISGHDDDVICSRGLADGNLNFIHKPFTPNTLSVKLRDLLDD